jgi:Flp pilus assembly protein TadD
VSYYQKGDYEQSVSSWQKALELIPGDAEVHNFIGISYHKLNRLKDATTHFVMATELDTNYYEAYNNLGYTLFLQKKYGEAQRSFKKALVINPQYTAAQLNYEKTKKIMSGELLRDVFELTEQAAKIDDVDKQVEFYEKILTIDSLNAEVHNNLGVAYYYSDSLDGAYAHLNAALALNKDYPEAINNIGYIYKVAGDYQTAVQLFLRAISSKPQYVIGLNNLGETYMLMNEFENARRVFQTVLEIDPAEQYAKDSLSEIEKKSSQ